MPAALLKSDIPPSPEVTAPATTAVEDRRGAMRPGRLVSSRARVAGQVLSAVFRAVDIILVGALGVITLQASVDLAKVSVATALPCALAAVILIACLNTFKAYGFRGGEDLGRHLLRVVAAFIMAGLAAGAAFVLLPGGQNPNGLLVLWLAAAFAGIFLVHIIDWSVVTRLRKTGKLTPNVVIVGSGKNAAQLIEAALRTGEVNVLGIFDDRADRAAPIKGVPILGDTSLLLSHRIIPFVDRIIIAVPSAAQARVRQIIDRVAVLPNPVTLFIDTGGPVEGARLARLIDAPLAYVSGRPDDPARAAVKRMQDILVGMTALILALPIMAAVAIAIRLDSPGPILFRQRRHGFNNEEVVVWKFRSMRVEAADARATRQISADDDRVTRVGKFIRRTSLDELPQIFNVLTGEMSLVGPRPHAIGMMTGEVESSKLVAEYAHRHRMKPGMTGWAAIKGSRGPVDTPELVRRRVALDVEYIERQSFWLDIYVMAMTIPCLLGDSETVR
jgi:Undecaprenyl-phosphate glucose phosphotransferase